MPPKRGRGGGRGGGAAAGAAAGHAKQARPDGRVARPGISEFPTSLMLNPIAESVPEAICTAFPEFTSAQPFFSALERLRPEYGGSVQEYTRCWLGPPAASIQSVERDEDSEFTATLRICSGGAGADVEKVPVFVKRIHLLDPISYMEGEYVIPKEGALPAPSELWKQALAKLNDPHNEAYVDALFAALASRLVTNGLSPHWCRCFGTFTARVDTYLYNIGEEYESLRTKAWWRRNLKNGMFSIFHDTDSAAEEEADAAEAARQRFLAAPGGTLSDEDFADLDAAGLAAPVQQPTICTAGSPVRALVEEDPYIDMGAAPVQLVAPKLRLKKLSGAAADEEAGVDTSTSSDDSDSASDYSDASDVFAEFTDFPVQVTLLEKAQGTMDELLDLEEDPDSAADLPGTKDARWAAWLFQVIAALTEAQYYFGFVHNDLHTNNIMWTETTDAYLYYRVRKNKETWYMRVPTFGRLMKIIDFGRASYHLPDPVGFFISDAFYPGNDASNQYNCEPFFDPKEGKRVEPNPSFDLCRLSVSLLDSLYPDRPEAVTPVRVLSREGAKVYTETVSGVYNMLWEWLQDDGGKNVLRNPDGEERYPSFDLYCALASDVHRAVPAKQVERAVFASYRCLAGDVPRGATVYELHI